MPIQILMPALSPTMEHGKLAKWLVKEGDKVASGKVLAEIETDKATMEVEAIDEGIVGKILVPEGTDGVAVNAPIAVLLEEGEDASAIGAPMPASAKAPSDAAETGRPGEGAGLRGGTPAPTSAATAALPQIANGKANGHGGRIFASPLARRVAKERGVDLAALTGSGPHGRIVLADVEKAPPPGAAQTPPKGQSLTVSPPPAASPLAMTDDQIMALYEPGSYEIAPHDNMRRTIAQRLTVAKSTIPHFYLNIDCELDKLLAARQSLNVRSPKDGPGAYKLSVNDFIIKALALALQRVPDANAVWSERGMVRLKRVDVAVAVAVEGGLFTPVIRAAEAKSLAQISNEMKDLAERARKRRLAPHEYQGGASSISNLGMFGIKAFDAVINPPHSTILAVGEGEQRAVVKGGALTVATVMSVTLSCDHRVVDGALGARLLSAFRGFIEEPVSMLV
ncbi:MAG: pyruvate dehydrogenase complex dihydrolipoamide acetyltransferase [Hyphomicrobiales bacterium]|nr:pyruvate dehydrogenase complex dihydrolipoamide acetyltransferase [Hyphomicrobiales bacterium]